MTPQEKAQLNELMAWKSSLESSATIPLNVGRAFKARLDVPPDVSVSSKSASSENQAVDEGGSATYSVLKAPDGFLELTIGTIKYYLPIFT